MTAFSITINGTTYDTFGDALEAVRGAWGDYCAAAADERARGDKADYLEWKAANRPDDGEWDGATPEEKALHAEIYAANLEAALAAREPVTAE